MERNSYKTITSSVNKFQKGVIFKLLMLKNELIFISLFILKNVLKINFTVKNIQNGGSNMFDEFLTFHQIHLQLINTYSWDFGVVIITNFTLDFRNSKWLILIILKIHIYLKVVEIPRVTSFYLKTSRHIGFASLSF